MGDVPGWIGSQLHAEEGTRRRKLTTEEICINFVEHLMYRVRLGLTYKAARENIPGDSPWTRLGRRRSGSYPVPLGGPQQAGWATWGRPGT